MSRIGSGLLKLASDLDAAGYSINDAATIEATDGFVDGVGNTVSNLAGGDLFVDGSTLKVRTPPDLRKSINNLVIETARQDFELGLSALNYSGGGFEIYATDSGVVSTTGVSVSYGSVLDGAGYVALQNRQVGDISVLTEMLTDRFNLAGADGYLVAAVSNDGAIDFLDISDGTVIETVELTTADTYVSFIEYSSEQFLALCDNGEVHRVDAETRSVEASNVSGGYDVKSGAIDKAAGYVYVATGDTSHTVYQLDYSDLSETGQTFTEHGYTVNGIVAESGRVWSAANNSEVKTWKASDMSVVSAKDNIIGSTGGYVKLDSDYLYVADRGGGAKQLDRDSLSINQTNDVGGDNCTALDIDDDYVYTADSGSVLRKIDKSDMSTVQDVSLSNDYDLTQTGGYIFYQYEGRIGGTISPETSGEVIHADITQDSAPSTAVLSDDVTIPPNADVSYELRDGAGNVEQISRSSVGDEVPVDFSGTEIEVRAILNRDTTDDERAVLDSWALYLD
jgi:hypothetical protein